MGINGFAHKDSEECEGELDRGNTSSVLDLEDT